MSAFFSLGSNVHIKFEKKLFFVKVKLQYCDCESANFNICNEKPFFTLNEVQFTKLCEILPDVQEKMLMINGGYAPMERKLFYKLGYNMIASINKNGPVLILRHHDLSFSLEISNVFEFTKQIDNIDQKIDELKTSYIAEKSDMKTSAAEIEETGEKLYLLVVGELAKKFALGSLECPGCEIDDPSQGHHECCTMSELTRLTNFLYGTVCQKQLFLLRLKIREIFLRVAVYEFSANDLLVVLARLNFFEHEYLEKYSGALKIFDEALKQYKEDTAKI